MKIYVALCALALSAFLVTTSSYAARPLSPPITEQTISGKINSRGTLVANDGKAYIITNFKNLPKDSIGKEVEVTGHVSSEAQVPLETEMMRRTAGRDTIEVNSVHVASSMMWWNNCVASCEPLSGVF